jgi:signal transduction histidine kinase
LPAESDGMRLRSKVLLLLAGLLSLALWGTLGVVHHDLRVDTLARTRAELERAASGFFAREEQNFRLLNSLANTLETSPALRRMLHQTDRVTVEDFLTEVQIESGLELVLLTDVEGRAGHLSEGSPEPQPEESTLQEALDGQYAVGYWDLPAGVYQVCTVPMTSAHQLIDGTISTGFYLDQRRLDDLAAQLGVDVELKRGDTVLVGTLPAHAKLDQYEAHSLPLSGSVTLNLMQSMAPMEALLARTSLRIGLLGLGVFLLALALGTPLVTRLTRASELLETVVDAMGEGLCHLDTQGRVLRLNAEAERLLQPEGSWKGLQLFEQIEVSTGEGLLQVKDLASPTRVLDGRISGPGLDFPVSFVSTPVQAKGRYLGAVLVFRDITAQKMQQEALTRAQVQAAQASKLAAVGQLAAGLAHELNSPLGAIRLHLEGALSKLQNPQRVERKLQHSLRALDGIQGLVNQLLSCSVNAPSQADHCDLGELVSQTVELVSQQFQLAGVELESSAAQGMRVGLSPPQLRQVLLNLLSNARDAASEDGARGNRVQLTAEAQQDTAVLTIADQGPGMAEEIQSRIFEPFFTTKPVGKGAGLGLTVVKSTVEGCGGRVEVESGQDTVFRVTLPLV